MKPFTSYSDCLQRLSEWVGSEHIEKGLNGFPRKGTSVDRISETRVHLAASSEGWLISAGEQSAEPHE
jgi:hypothetical protein